MTPAAIAFSVYLAGMAAAMLFAGKVADRSGRKPVAIPGAALFIIASVFCSLAETSTLFLAGRFLQGLGAGCCYVVAFAILRDTLDDRRRAKVLSLLWQALSAAHTLRCARGEGIFLRTNGPFIGRMRASQA